MKTKRPLRFEYGKNDDGQFYWHVKAANGEIVAQGEGYKRRAGVLKVFGVLFKAESLPTLVYLNEGDRRKPRFVAKKKPKGYAGKLNRNWP